MFKCHDSREGDTYQERGDLNKLLGHTHIPPSPEKWINKPESANRSQTVSTAVSNTWADVMRKNPEQADRQESYRHTSSSLKFLEHLWLKGSFSQIPELDKTAQISHTQPMRADANLNQPENWIPHTLRSLGMHSWKRGWPAETSQARHLQGEQELTRVRPTLQSMSTCATWGWPKWHWNQSTITTMKCLKGKSTWPRSNFWRILLPLRHSCGDPWAGWPTIESWGKWDGWLYYCHSLSSLPSCHREVPVWALCVHHWPLRWVRALAPQTTPPSAADWSTRRPSCKE